MGLATTTRQNQTAEACRSQLRENRPETRVLANRAAIEEGVNSQDPSCRKE